MKSPSENLTLRIINGGHHHPDTWAGHFPDFLQTAFNRKVHLNTIKKK